MGASGPPFPEGMRRASWLCSTQLSPALLCSARLCPPLPSSAAPPSSTHSLFVALTCRLLCPNHLLAAIVDTYGLSQPATNFFTLLGCCCYILWPC